MYFLAIVGDPDIKVGNWVPSYVLCRTKVTSEHRTGWRVIDANGKFRDHPKILVKTIDDKDYMIDFLSKFRTRKHRHDSKKYRKKNTKKFYPSGMLCWFECDRYGRSTGQVILIKRVPDMSLKREGMDCGKKILENHQNKIPNAKEIFNHTDSILLAESGVKCQIPQKIKKKKQWNPWLFRKENTYG